MNRREFCVGVGSALGLVASRETRAGEPTPAPSPGAATRPTAAAPQPLDWHAYASRYLAPPVFRFTPIRNAVAYRAEIRSATYRADRRDAAKARYSVSSRTPTLSFEPVWNDLLTGPGTATVSAVDRSGQTLAAHMLLLHKARPFEGAIPRWKHSVEDMVEGVASFLINVRSPNAVEPDRSPLLWHAIIDTANRVRPLGYPTHNAYHIEFFIEYAKWTKNAELARQAILLGRELADFNIQYRTPADWTLPNMFYTTAVEGQLGGDKDRDTIIVTLAGLMGRSLLRLGLDQHEPRYVRAAVDTARCLLATQLPQGNWPFRVEPKSGRIDNAYTSSAILPVLLFDELMAAPKAVFKNIETTDLRPSLEAARTRALRWLIEGPMTDYRWEGFCEDVGDMAPYVATQWYDAVWTAKYFIDHRDEFPSQLEPALAILDWIEDQFVCWSVVDVPYLESPAPVVPVVMEQYRCYKPVDCCNAWFFEGLLAAHEATNREVYLRKSQALAAAITHWRRPSGSVATWGFYVPPDRREDLGDWFACMVYDAHMIMRHGKTLV